MKMIVGACFLVATVSSFAQTQDIKNLFNTSSPATLSDLQEGMARDCQFYLWKDEKGLYSPQSYPIVIGKGLVSEKPKKVGLNMALMTCGLNPGIDTTQIAWGDSIKVSETKTSSTSEFGESSEIRALEDKTLVIKFLSGSGAINGGYLVCPPSDEANICDQI